MMALYRLEVRHQQKARSSGAARGYASYIRREGDGLGYSQYVGREREIKDDLIHHEVGNMPEWAAENAGKFWMAADASISPGRAVFTEILVTLPRELTDEQNVALVQSFVAKEIGERYPYEWAMHKPDASDGNPHPHAHIVMNTRRMDDGIERGEEQFFKYHRPSTPETSGAPNEYKTFTKQKIYQLRESWAQEYNLALEQAGHEMEVSAGWRQKEDHEIALTPLDRKAFAALMTALRAYGEEQGKAVCNHPEHLSASEITTLHAAGRITAAQEHYLRDRLHNHLGRGVSDAYEQAKEDLAMTVYLERTGARTRVGEMTRSEAELDFQYPSDAPVIGNTNSGVYHMPGQRNYGDVAPHHQVHFVTQREAIEAGFREARHERGVGGQTPMEAIEFERSRAVSRDQEDDRDKGAVGSEQIQQRRETAASAVALIDDEDYASPRRHRRGIHLER